MPVVATPAGGTDGHMAILTATHSFEMWGSGTWTPGEGRYGCRYGAIFDLRGDSLSTDGHGATAAGTSLLAGQIRLSELQAGYIPLLRSVRQHPTRARWRETPTTCSGRSRAAVCS
jgi:hypothetical protein